MKERNAMNEHVLAWSLVSDVYYKLVPTALDFSPSLPGGFCIVYIGTWAATLWLVTVRGLDDCAIQRCFQTFEEALALFNRTQWLETHADLAEFEVGDTNHNGWPRNA